MSERWGGMGWCALSFLWLTLTGCYPRHPATFVVVPESPVYVLRSPDSRQTSLPDVLREYNGYQAGRGWIDLGPMMELRIENAYYEKGSSRRGLQGFLGTEVARYEVRKEGLRLLSVESMQGRPEADVPVQGLIAPAAMDARVYRLYFEIFNPANNTHGSVLLAAHSREELEQLAAQLDHPEKLCGAGATNCTAFPEACSVSVEMQIVVNGKADTRVWGSLLSSVVGGNARRLEFKRLYAGRPTPVKVDLRDASALQVPLLPGDRITWK